MASEISTAGRTVSQGMASSRVFSIASTQTSITRWWFPAAHSRGASAAPPRRRSLVASGFTPAGERWRDVASGAGRATMTNVIAGRTFTSELEMTVWDPPREFRYLARQPGAPALDNRRVFEPAPSGTRMRGTTEGALRAGVQGLADRVRLQALRKNYADVMARLPDAALAAHRSKGE